MRMSKWLTTGEMIDQLKVGEVAENDTGFTQVFYDEKTGYLVFTTKGNLSKIYYKFEFNVDGKGEKWRILPKYVSFEEAMEALNKGKITHFHPFHNQSVTVHPDANLQGWIETYTWKDLITGKWTIENV